MKRTLFLFLFLACFSVASAQSVLSGRVITPSGTQPTNPVRVRLTFNGRAINETFSDLSGRFTFPGINRGRYQLIAEGDGLSFETTTVYVDVGAFGGSQNVTLDIQLRPLAAKASTQPGVVNAFTQNVPEAAKQAF